MTIEDPNKVVSDDPSKKVSDPNANGGDAPGESVKYDTYKKLLGQHKQTQEEREALAKKIAEYEAAERKRQEDEIVKEGDYKKIIQLREQEKSDLQKKLDEVTNRAKQAEDTVINALKLNALQSELPARLKRSEYSAFLPINDIVFDPETGEIDQSSVKLAAQGFVENYSDLLDKKNITGLPSDSAKGSKKIDVSAYRQMNAKDKRNNLAAAVANWNKN